VRYRRNDIVERAVGILDQYGLPDLSMRRIATELGLQPSALYHHFANKQELLAAVADEVLRRGERGATGATWDAAVVAVSHELRDAMLAYRDGAELVATVHAFGLGERSPAARLTAAVESAGLDADVARPAAMTVLHFVFGHVSDEQMHLQANSVGAIDADPGARAGTASFDLGLSLITEGIRHHTHTQASSSTRP